MVTLIVTKKGSELKQNSWEEGQVITCHENLAEMFIENGFCVNPNDLPKDEAEIKTTKTTKKK